jgi:tripartite ATP-independent transporter DctM subunit
VAVTDTITVAPGRSSAGLLDTLEQASGALALHLAAALIILETVLLGAGVFCRYVLHSPIPWSDELALILFAWLAMMGAVVALRNREHMRLTFVVARARPSIRNGVDVFSWLSAALVVATLFAASVTYTIHSAPEITPALRISAAYRTGALNVGFAMMLLTSLRRLRELGTFRSIAISTLILTALLAALKAATPWLQDIGNYSLLVFFVGLVLVFIVIGVEIAFAFSGAAIAYIYLLVGAPLSIVTNRLDATLSDIILLSIPMFVFLGVLIELTGIARALIDLLTALVGRARGGLHYVLLGGMYLVSGISGSKSADMAAIAPILFPAMKARGANEGELVSLLSSSAAMAETIPPSLILIAVGVSAGLSISDLFVGGLVPALVGMIALGAVIYVRHRKQPAPTGAGPGRRQIGRLFVVAIPALILPLVIRVAVVEGIATATEVATIGILYAVVCGLFVYRQFPIDRLPAAFSMTVSLTGAILLVTGLAGGMAWALTQSGFADDMMDMVRAIPGGWITFMIFSIVFFAILGSILEGYPAIVMFAPLMFPLAQQLGIHPIHYAMVVVLSMSIGLFAPPFGVGFYAACAIGQVQPDKAMRDIWIYMGAFAVAVLVVAFFPWLSIGFVQ